jgi:hypothetical protein
MNDEERQLWQIGRIECVMVSCCSGAELQIRKDGEITWRELYPMKSDLYDCAQQIKSQVSSLKSQVSSVKSEDDP